LWYPYHMFSKPHQLFKNALAQHYSIGAFNVSNLEFAQAVIGAAETLKAPVIAQTSEKAIEYAGVKVIARLVKLLAEQASVPVVLHLDHGKSLETVKKCIEAGYTSVMIDASTKPFEENIQTVKEVVDYAHQYNVWVEAELGAILGKEGAVKLAGEKTPESMFTDPTQAKQFVTETNVDSLAVSVGTIHGVFAGQEYIRFELVEKIKAVLPNFPLVIHGASGVKDDEIKRVTAYNVGKINVDTELRIAFDDSLRDFLKKQTDMVDPRDVLGAARAAVQAKVEEKIKLFGSEGKA